MIALSGLLLMLSTVHIWGPITVFVMAYLGAGSWFYTGDQRLKPAETARQRRERAAALRAGGPGDGRRREGERAGTRRLCGRVASAMTGGLFAGAVSVKQSKAGRPAGVPAPAARKGRRPARTRGKRV